MHVLDVEQKSFMLGHKVAGSYKLASKLQIGAAFE